MGVVVGHDFFALPAHALAKRTGVVRSFANWDGEHYLKILTAGYSYDPARQSNVAFFPAYPLLGRLVARGTGVDPEVALLVVSHICLAASFALFATYARLRGGGTDPHLTYLSLLAFGLFPTTVFWQMAYSESLFVLCCLLVFYGMERRWPLLLLALLVGLSTATRPVGVALLPPFIFHLWGRSRGGGQFFTRLGCYLLPACWGILAYMLYLQWAFGDPLAFANTQTHWNLRPPAAPVDKFVALVTLEPLWCVFDSGSRCYWLRYELGNDPFFTLHATNPLYFLAAAGLTLLGAWRGWLTRPELLFCCTLVLVPYVSRGQEMCLAGMARFVATAFPLYLVLGRLLHALPAPVATALLSVSGFLLGIYAALFASWHRFI